MDSIAEARTNTVEKLQALRVKLEIRMQQKNSINGLSSPGCPHKIPNLSEKVLNKVHRYIPLVQIRSMLGAADDGQSWYDRPDTSKKVAELKKIRSFRLLASAVFFIEKRLHAETLRGLLPLATTGPQLVDADLRLFENAFKASCASKKSTSMKRIELWVLHLVHLNEFSEAVVLSVPDQLDWFMSQLYKPTITTSPNAGLKVLRWFMEPFDDAIDVDWIMATNIEDEQFKNDQKNVKATCIIFFGILAQQCFLQVIDHVGIELYGHRRASFSAAWEGIVHMHIFKDYNDVVPTNAWPVPGHFAGVRKRKAREDMENISPADKRVRRDR